MTTLNKILEEGWICIEDYSIYKYKIYKKDNLRLLYNPESDEIIVRYNFKDNKDNGEDMDKLKQILKLYKKD